MITGLFAKSENNTIVMLCTRKAGRLVKLHKQGQLQLRFYLKSRALSKQLYDGLPLTASS